VINSNLIAHHLATIHLLQTTTANRQTDDRRHIVT